MRSSSLTRDQTQVPCIESMDHLEPPGKSLCLVLEEKLLFPKEFWIFLFLPSGLPGGSGVKNLPAKRETQVQFLGQEDRLEMEMATIQYSGPRNPMDRGPYKRQRGVGHDLATEKYFSLLFCQFLFHVFWSSMIWCTCILDGPDFESDCKVIESAHNFKGQETGHILRYLNKLFILLHSKRAETVDAITIVVPRGEDFVSVERFKEKMASRRQRGLAWVPGERRVVSKG